MAFVCLDNVSSWTPPVAEELEAASSLQQRPDDSSPSLSEPTPAPIVEHSDGVRVACGQSLDQPILIPSDIDSDMSVAGDSGAEQEDGRESDSSLPTLEALIARSATLQRGNPSRREDPDPWPEDHGPMAERASPTLGHPWRETDTDVDASLVPSSSWHAVPTAQADDATRSCEENRKTSSGYGGPDRSGGAASAVGICRGTPGSCDSSSRPQRRGFLTKAGMPWGSEAVPPGCVIGTPQRKSKRPRRPSRRRGHNTVAHLGPDPDATSKSEDGTSLRSGSNKMRGDAALRSLSPGLSEVGQGHQRAGSGVAETDDESDAQPRKRRKLSPFQVSTGRKSQRGSSSPGPNAVNSSAHTAASHSVCNIPSPPPSRRHSQTHPARTTGARFEEWHLPNATLKRVQLSDGRATFQLQFDWDPCGDGRPADCSNSNGTQSPTSRKGGRRRRVAAPSIIFTPEEEELLIQLKEGKDGLTWAAIHEQFSEQFPGRRSRASLQVRYSTKLKGRTAEGVSQERATMASDLTFVPGSPIVPVDPALWNA